MKKILNMMAVAIIIIYCIISCNEKTTEPYEEPNYLENDFEEIHEKFYASLTKYDIIIRIGNIFPYLDDFNKRGIDIWSKNDFYIDSCSLFIDNEEILLYKVRESYFYGSFEMWSDITYHLEFEINGVSFETEYTMPSVAKISILNKKFNPKKDYSFSWKMKNDHYDQFVGVKVFGLKGLPYDYVLTELAPSKRNYIIKSSTIHSSYNFTGVFVYGRKYVIQDNIILFTEVFNERYIWEK